MLWGDIRNSAGDAWDVWTSPFRASQRDWLTAGGIVVGAAAITPLDPPVDRLAVRYGNDGVFRVLDPVRPGGFLYSGRTITPIAVGALAASLAFKSRPWQEGLFGCATAYASSSVVRTFVIYPLVARTSPDSSRGAHPSPPAKEGDQYDFSFPGTSDWGRHAFPGGHVANVAACAEFLTRRFDMGWVEPAIWTLVGGVGVARAIDRAHWTSDQVFGLLFGYAVGKEVALRSLRRASRTRIAADDDHNHGQLLLDASSAGVRVGWSEFF